MKIEFVGIVAIVFLALITFFPLLSFGGGGGGSVVDANLGFIDLNDTPTTYVGQANKFVQVNPGETALIFTSASASGDTNCSNNTACILTGRLNSGFDLNAIDININDIRSKDSNIVFKSVADTNRVHFNLTSNKYGFGTSNPLGRIDVGLNGQYYASSDQNHENGELIRLIFNNKDNPSAKAAIAFQNQDQNTKAWLVSHYKSTDGTDHNHFSIEVTDDDGQLQTRLEFPFDNNISDVQFNQSNVRIIRNTGYTNGNLIVEGTWKDDGNFQFFPHEASNATQSLRIDLYPDANIAIGVSGSNFITFIDHLIPQANNTFDLGRADRKWRVINTTDLNVTKICIGTDCRTAWPTGGGGGGTVYTSGTPGTIQVDNDANTISQNFDGNFWTRIDPLFPVVDANITDLSWTKLQNYPTGCGTFLAVQVIGDTLTCISLPSEANIDGNALAVVNALDLNNSLSYSKTDTNCAVSGSCINVQYKNKDMNVFDINSLDIFPRGDNNSDFGSPTLRFRDAWFSRDVNAGSFKANDANFYAFTGMQRANIVDLNATKGTIKDLNILNDVNVQNNLYVDTNATIADGNININKGCIIFGSVSPFGKLCFTTVDGNVTLLWGN